jgi:hypothetical protein
VPTAEQEARLRAKNRQYQRDHRRRVKEAAVAELAGRLMPDESASGAVRAEIVRLGVSGRDADVASALRLAAILDSPSLMTLWSQAARQLKAVMDGLRSAKAVSKFGGANDDEEDGARGGLASFAAAKDRLRAVV